LPTYDAPTPAGQPEIIEVDNFPDDDEDFFGELPSDFQNILAAVPTEEFNEQMRMMEQNLNAPKPQPQPQPQLRTLLIQNANANPNAYQASIPQSPPVYQHYTSTEELSQLPSWQSIVNNITGMQM
jgi:hypothetical protein